MTRREVTESGRPLAIYIYLQVRTIVYRSDQIGLSLPSPPRLRVWYGYFAKKKIHTFSIQLDCPKPPASRQKNKKIRAFRRQCM